MSELRDLRRATTQQWTALAALYSQRLTYVARNEPIPKSLEQEISFAELKLKADTDTMDHIQQSSIRAQALQHGEHDLPSLLHWVSWLLPIGRQQKSEPPKCHCLSSSSSASSPQSPCEGELASLDFVSGGSSTITRRKSTMTS